MKKSLLIASLAVISMNVLGMHPFENNNRNGNNPKYALTPDSSPRSDAGKSLSADQQLWCRIFELEQKNLRLNQQNQQLLSSGFELNASIAEKDTKISELNNSVAEKDNAISGLNNQIAQFQSVNRQLTSSNETLRRTNIQLIFEKHILNQNVAEKNNKISGLNNQIAQVQSVNWQLASNNENLHRINAQLTSEKRTLNQDIAEKEATILELNNFIARLQSENQRFLRDVQQLSLQNEQKAQFISKLDKQNRKLNGSLISVKRMFRNIAKQTFRKGSVRITKSALEDFVIRVYNSSNKTNVIINELFEGNTAEGAIVLSNPLNLRSFAKRPAPEDDSVSQPSAQRRRIDPEEATSSTNHLQQPVEIRDENAVNRQNDIEQIDQNLADLITLNYWGGAFLNPEECIKLFSYLTDPNYAGGISGTYYLKYVNVALNIWNVITSNEREYLSILARNIHIPLKEFPIQDRERINELETAIRADRNILPGENLKIEVNTGHKDYDLIEIINDVKERENGRQKPYWSEVYINLLITVLAQTNWPAQPCFATEEELNNFEQSVQAFVDQYHQRKSELENSNNPNKDRLIKTNTVDTVRNLRRFGIGDRLIANKLNLFSSNDENEAIQKFKSLYPCLQKGAPFNIARKKTIEALKWQGKSNKEISAILGMSYGRVCEMWKSINSY